MSGSWSNATSSLIVLVTQISGYAGIFGYSPDPGAGNLVFSITAAAGTDPYGNAYPAGFAIGFDTGPQAIMSYTASSGFTRFPANSPGEGTVAQISGSVSNSGLASESVQLTHRGPAENGTGTDRIDIVQRSDFQDGSSEAVFRLDLNGTSTLLAVDKTNGVQANRQILVQTTGTSSVPLKAIAPGGQTADLLALLVGASQVFTVNAAGSVAAANMDWGSASAALVASSTVDVTVTFAKTFPNTPRVVATLSNSPTLPAGSSALIVRVFGVSTTGCTLRVSDVGAVARTLTIGVDWHAISS